MASQDLTPQDVAELAAWRQVLHRFPEVSGKEKDTAARVVAALADCAPDQVITGLGGHGVAAVWQGVEAGPTVLFRAELDALPIYEKSDIAHRSLTDGWAHLCGHDGHMAQLMGLARLIHRARPKRGRVVLLFQPAEEDGSGAGLVVADPRYGAIKPDWAFAIHNMPGMAFGHCAIRAGVVNCASVGVRIVLEGKTAHASLPETGLSPARALASLIPALADLGQGGPLGPDYRLVTVTHARLGEPAFGIAPGLAEVWVTLRTMEDGQMAALRDAAFGLAQAVAAQSVESREGLVLTISQSDDFAASVNDAQAVARVRAALDALGMRHDEGDLPMRASEDFGRIGQAGTRGAMLFVGAGEDHAALHNPDYDFPDALIPLGVALFDRVMRDLLD